jgi:hypothetical protein
MFVSDFERHSEANQATGPHDTKMFKRRLPLKIWPTSLMILLTSTTTLGQAQPTSQPTFHISGKITQSGRAVPGVWVTFEGAIPKSVKGNDSGFYQADLPLGAWRVFVSGFNERDRSEFSRPRVFQVNKAGKVALDLFVRPAVGCGGVTILTSDVMSFGLSILPLCAQDEKLLEDHYWRESQRRVLFQQALDELRRAIQVWSAQK